MDIEQAQRGGDHRSGERVPLSGGGRPAAEPHHNDGYDGALGRGARLLGAAVLAVLALFSLAWIVRDFLRANEVMDVWWMWSGLLFRAQDGVWASSLVEPTLLVLYTVCAVTAARSSSATGVLATTGALTVVLRFPSLWNLNATWIRGGVSAGLREKALFSVITLIMLGISLIVAAFAGRRRPDGEPSPAEEPPARPTRGGAVTAFLVLTASAGALAAWQVYSLLDQGWKPYLRHIAGDRSLVTLLAVPENYLSWVTAAFALAAALASLARTSYARPLGMTISAPLIGLGLFYLSFTVRAGLLTHFATLGVYDRLRLVTALFETAAGVAVLVALARRDTGRPQDT